MQIIHVKDYDTLSKYCADQMLECIRRKPDAVFCLATGNSVVGAYELFVQRVIDERVDVSGIRIVKLDEWLDIPLADESTCEYFLKKYVLNPLGILEDRYLSFQTENANFNAEIPRIENQIEIWGGIDFLTLGIGMNGHLGLNEPGETIKTRSHVSALSEKSKTHSMLRGQRVSRGVTLGLDQIMKARCALLLITGKNKQEAVKGFLKGELTTAIPATCMYLHPNAQAIVSEDVFE